MHDLTRFLLVAGLGTSLLVGCSDSGTPGDSTTTTANGADGDGHDHDGDDHAGHDHGGHEHHDEVSLGTTMIGEWEADIAQAHGDVEPGKDMALVVKLPYSDEGATIVRAWIGTENKMLSMVGKAIYAPSHDDYDLHTEAPDPLPEDAKWWIEIERPDGVRATGSIDFR